MFSFSKEALADPVSPLPSSIYHPDKELLFRSLEQIALYFNELLLKYCIQQTKQLIKVVEKHNLLYMPLIIHF